MEANDTGRKLDKLEEAECLELIRPGGIGRLAVSINNRPDIFPVNYLVDGTSVVIRTAAGLKLAAAVLGTGIAFEVDRLNEDNKTAWSVVLKGPAREIVDLKDLLAAEDLDLHPWAGTDGKNRFIRLEPLIVTGRRIELDHQLTATSPTTNSTATSKATSKATPKTEMN